MAAVPGETLLKGGRFLSRNTALAVSATMRKVGESAGSLVYVLGSALGCSGVVSPDISNDGGEVVSGFGRPANFHLRTEHPLDALAYLFVREVFGPGRAVPSPRRAPPRNGAGTVQ